MVRKIIIDAKYDIYIPNVVVLNVYKSLIEKEKWLEARIILNNLIKLFPSKRSYKKALVEINANIN